MTCTNHRVAFVVGNDRHHVAAALPVIEQLRAAGTCQCSIISICEFRGTPSPELVARRNGIPLTPVVPFPFRSQSLGETAAGAESRLREIGREIAWRLLCKPGLEELYRDLSAVVLPNDGAFPYTRIASDLSKHGVPFVVLQEGIRFAVPAVRFEGTSPPAAYAVWGESSAKYFESRGISRSIIRVVGAPRFDAAQKTNWAPEAAKIRAQLPTRAPLLLFLSNPIDDLGFVTGDEKLALTRRFVETLSPCLDADKTQLVLKLHPRESKREFESVLGPLARHRAVTIVDNWPLYPLLASAAGAVTFASSVGLEALLFGIPLAVLELPGHGFPHDFVSSGAAVGLRWSDSLHDELDDWLDGNTRAGKSPEEYLADRLANVGRAGEEVARLIATVIES